MLNDVRSLRDRKGGICSVGFVSIGCDPRGRAIRYDGDRDKLCPIVLMNHPVNVDTMRIRIRSTRSDPAHPRLLKQDERDTICK